MCFRDAYYATKCLHNYMYTARNLFYYLFQQDLIQLLQHSYFNNYQCYMCPRD